MGFRQTIEITKISGKGFKDEVMTFAKTAEKFEKLLPKEVTNSILGFEIWRIAQKRLDKPIVYMKFK